MSAGGLSRRLRDGGAGSSSASGRRPSSDSGNSCSGAAAVQHSSGLPASEATLERRGQVGSQRQTISRVICGPTAAKPAAGAWQSWGDVDLDVPQDPPARCGTQHLCTVLGFADISLSVRCQGCAAKVVPLPVSIGRCLGAPAGLPRNESRPSSHGPTSCRPTCEAATLALFRLQPRSERCLEVKCFLTALHVLSKVALRQALLFTGLGPPQCHCLPNPKQALPSVPPRLFWCSGLRSEPGWLSHC